MKRSISMNRVFSLTIALIAFMILIPGFHSNAETQSAREYQIKAAFLYNFAKFIQWPEKPGVGDESTFNLCVLGKDPFGETLDSLEGTRINGRKVSIKRLSTLEEVENCQIIFVCRSEQNQLNQIIARLEGENVLTVGDMEDFARRGGVISFMMIDRKVRFDVNIDAAERAGLHISSKLLKLANFVHDKPGKGRL
jgi:hypothetical protein